MLNLSLELNLVKISTSTHSFCIKKIANYHWIMCCRIFMLLVIFIFTSPHFIKQFDMLHYRLLNKCSGVVHCKVKTHKNFICMYIFPPVSPTSGQIVLVLSFTCLHMPIQTPSLANHHTSSVSASTPTCSDRSRLPPPIGCSTNAGNCHWPAEVPFKPNSIAVVLEMWRQMYGLMCQGEFLSRKVADQI